MHLRYRYAETTDPTVAHLRKAGAHGAEIQVTPEMIEAGLKAFYKYRVVDGPLGADKILFQEIIVPWPLARFFIIKRSRIFEVQRKVKN